MGVGTKGDYEGLARWHYRAGRPIAVTRVLVARYREKCRVSSVEFRDQHLKLETGNSKLETGNSKLIGVLVETRPVLNCRLRNVALGGRYVGGNKRGLARRLNREVTTIARVIVEPRFRGIGVAEALVRRALATARTPYVEALASMGRVQRFFEHAGMARFDRPMPAESVRLLAALARENLVPGDLGGLRAHEVSGFLGRELRRFARGTKHEGAKHTKTHEGIEPQSHRETEDAQRQRGEIEENRRGKEGIRAAMAEARRRVGSWPAYYIWRRPGARVPRVAAAGEVGEMAEALTVFMSAAEKARVVAALRGTDPDLGRALCAWGRKLATNEHE